MPAVSPQTESETPVRHQSLDELATWSAAARPVSALFSS